MKIALFSLLICLSPMAALAAQTLEFCNLSAAIKGVRQSPAAQSSLLNAYLKDKQFIYVSGFAGCSDTEFSDNAKMIHAIDPKVPIKTICPESTATEEDNVAFILSRIREIAGKNPARKLILIGQSKGAAESVLTAAKNPEIFDTDAATKFGARIASVIALNSVIGGSILPDLYYESEPVMSQKWKDYKVANKVADGLLQKVLASIFLHTGSPGFKSMSTIDSAARNQALIGGLDLSTRKQLAERVFFVTTSRDPLAKDMPFYMKDLAKFMSEQDEPNDGLVFERDQALVGLGTQLLSLTNAGHFSLVGPYDESYCREEFMRLMLLKIATR